MKQIVSVLLGLGVLYVKNDASFPQFLCGTFCRGRSNANNICFICRASAATIAKLVILVKLQRTKGYKEDWLHYQLLEWAAIEVGLAIFAAAAAALRPLVRRLTGHSLPDITTTDKSATAVAVTGHAEQTSGTEASPQRTDTENTGSVDTSEQYELRSFNSKEPTLKIEDEEQGQQVSIKKPRSAAS